MCRVKAKNQTGFDSNLKLASLTVELVGMQSADITVNVQLDRGSMQTKRFVPSSVTPAQSWVTEVAHQ